MSKQIDISWENNHTQRQVKLVFINDRLLVLLVEKMIDSIIFYLLY